jgi:hypothetical protein
MTFLPRQPKPPTSGRKPGVRNKATLMQREQGLSAIETFRNMGVSLPELGAKLVSVLNAVALAEIPNQQLDEIKNLTPDQRYRLAKYCDMGVKAIAALMEFSYPRVARIHYLGDAPSAPTVENRYRFVLNIDTEPGRPVAGNRHAAAAGNGDGARVIDAAPNPAHHDD